MIRILRAKSSKHEIQQWPKKEIFYFAHAANSIAVMLHDQQWTNDPIESVDDVDDDRELLKQLVMIQEGVSDILPMQLASHTQNRRTN